MNQIEEFRRQSPPPLAPRPLNLPTPQETTLDNGLRVVIVEDSRLPLVSFRLAVRAGNSHDPQHLPGLSDVLATMLTEGTESLTSRELADEVARLGATLAAGSSSDYSTIAASSLASYSDRVLELLAEVALRPIFPPHELEIVRQNAEQSLIAQRGQPSFLANERVSQVLFGAHPYSVVAPTPASLAAIDSATLAEFHRQKFVPGAAVLFVVGDVERDAVLERVNTLFGAWAGGLPPAEEFPAPPARAGRVAYIVDRPNSAQSNIVIANLGVTRT
ncbi:MAG TPA: pitrilysin family protein, partial [Pyrinomonadaceae bacterium]|nr:pitrilysin family protein [Pyrinomonadaceae bacterium]